MPQAPLPPPASNNTIQLVAQLLISGMKFPADINGAAGQAAGRALAYPVWEALPFVPSQLLAPADAQHHQKEDAGCIGFYALLQWGEVSLPPLLQCARGLARGAAEKARPEQAAMVQVLLWKTRKRRKWPSFSAPAPCLLSDNALSVLEEHTQPLVHAACRQLRLEQSTVPGGTALHEGSPSCTCVRSPGGTGTFGLGSAS